MKSKLIMDLVETIDHDLNKYYHNLLEELKMSYQKSWTNVLKTITPLSRFPAVINGKVKSSRDKKMIKKTFQVNCLFASIRYLKLYMYVFFFSYRILIKNLIMHVEYKFWSPYLMKHWEKNWDRITLNVCYQIIMNFIRCKFRNTRV